MVDPEGSRRSHPRGPRPLPQPDKIVLLISGTMGPADAPGLCQLLRVLLEASDAAEVVCDVAALVDPDAVAVEALARLQLTARGFGRRVLLRHACGELQDLVAFMGLREVLPLCDR